MRRKPEWLRVKLGAGSEFARIRRIVGDGRLHTVCQEAMCPNMGECWNQGRATLMILGQVCSRSCRFCNVASAIPGECDKDEPRRVAEAVSMMGLKEVVVTSVTRDDLPYGGAGIWAQTMRSIRELNPGIQLEVLVPDFNADRRAFDLVAAERPEIFGHNLETVRRMYDAVRPHADYDQSLRVLEWSSDVGMITKTGIMVGVGETDEEVFELMDDARSAGCRILYVGQYLQPTKKHWPVARYVEPAIFEKYRRRGIDKGFDVVVSGPLVRSSYHSEEQTRFVRSHVSSPVEMV